MKTTSERLDSLEDKMDRVIKYLNPDKEETNSNGELLSKFEEFKQEVRVLIDSTKGLCLLDIEEEDKNFYRNMWNYALIGFSGSAVLTILTYKFSLFFFPLAFSLFFAFSLIGLGLLHDKYLLPGNTIRRIASNAIASSIFWLAFTIASVAGFSIGNTIISDPLGGEERSNRAEPTRYFDNTAAPESGYELRLGEGAASEE